MPMAKSARWDKNGWTRAAAGKATRMVRAGLIEVIHPTGST